MNKESGQVTIFAALMLIVFISVAAFCMNAAYAFHQHTQMQAQVDTATLRAAGTGCVAYSSGGISIQPSPTFGPYAGDPKYCGGTYTKKVDSLFGKIMPVWFPISVQAVARHGGSSEPPFAFLGLSATGISHNCSVLFAGSSTITVTGNVLSNSPGIYPTDCNQDSGASPTIVGGAYLNPPPTYYDPYELTVPTSGGGVTPVVAGCPSGWVCYKPTSSTGIAQLPSVLPTGTHAKLKLLPYDATTPGVYLIMNTNSLNAQYLDVVGSSIVLETGGSLANGSLSGNCNDSTATPPLCWNLVAPTTGTFKGISIYEATPCVFTGSPRSQTGFGVGGGVGFKIDGLLDMECADIDLQGGAGDTFKGAVVGYTIKISGGSGGSIFMPADTQPPRGAFLVQ